MYYFKLIRSREKKITIKIAIAIFKRSLLVQNNIIQLIYQRQHTEIQLVVKIILNKLSYSRVYYYNECIGRL